MMKYSDKRRARGFTLAEVIVALAVIIIVTASALTLVASHTRLEQKSLQTVEAAGIAENVIESFRWWKNNEAADEENGTDSPAFLSVLDSIGIAPDTEADENENRYIYTVKDEINNGNPLRTYKLQIGIDANTITVVVHLPMDQNEFIKQVYTKNF